MEYISLSVITVGSKDLTIGGARSDDTHIHSNQVRAFINRRGHGYQGISFGSLKSGTEI